MNSVVEIKHVTKRYGKIEVLKDVSLTCKAGKIYGLIGRNGSGKTVLLKSICGFVLPTSGEVRVQGQQVGKDVDFPTDIGFIIESPGFLARESGLQNLMHLASIRGKASAEDVRQSMYTVGLDPDLRKPVGKYSMGMRQRLGIAQAIMENPNILILDEPMNGLDNQGVTDIRQVLKQLKASGKTILIASHFQEDIDLLCDEVYEMDAGIIKRKKEG
ncbi:MAG: ABC transporter ATP-binding protein [Oscillospiraceae bacterium]|nr:ABC transporter ATP-binding protein [Oscillospiraceae bacterium]